MHAKLIQPIISLAVIVKTASHHILEPSLVFITKEALYSGLLTIYTTFFKRTQDLLQIENVYFR
jgi:hypothetical protein